MKTSVRLTFSRICSSNYGLTLMKLVPVSFWIAGYLLAKETGIAELKKFAKGLDRAREGLLSYCRHRITSAKIEAFNGTIKRIVYKACGYNDLDYLYLKIRQEAAK